MTVENQSEPEQSDLPSRSRENALAHGFTGDGVVLPRAMASDVEDRRRGYVATYRPRSLHEHDLAYKAALGMVRHLHLQEMFHSRLASRSQLAAVQWPLLREADAIERSKRLAYNPPDVVAQLKLSLGGVAWLLREWRMLRLALDTPEGWNPKLQARAENLAGVARVHRHLDPEKLRGGTPEVRQALVDGRIAELERLLNDPDLARLDEAERQEVIAGLDGHRDPMFDRLMRYEQRALRLHENAIRQLEASLAARAEAQAPASEPDPAPQESRQEATAAPNGLIGFKPSSGSPRGEDSAEAGRIIPPFARRFTRDEYLATITDPECIRQGGLCDIPDPDHELWKVMAAWIDQEGLDLDVGNAVRALLGYALRTGRQISGAGRDPRPASASTPSPPDQRDRREAARQLKEVRKLAELARKNKRKAQAQSRKRYR